MAIEVTDIEETAPESVSESAPESAPQESVPESASESASEAKVSPAKRGRPPGAKDKAPRKRRPISIESPPRPVTRRSSAPKRVQIVEDESSEEVTPPPSPRTQRHQEWTAYRQRQADTHQANVNRHACLFDRMLA